MTGPVDELEVKARIDDAAALMRALTTAAATLVFAGEMIDRRFDRDGALAARDEVVRLRVYRPSDGGPVRGVLGWKGPAEPRGAYRLRAELETTVADPDAAFALLERLGFRTTLRIDRAITQYTLAGAVLRIERYPGMDTLLEVEGAPAAIERAIAGTGLARERFLPESLPFFVREYERRTGRPAVLAGAAS